MDDDDFGSNGITAGTIKSRNTMLSNGHLGSNANGKVLSNSSNSFNSSNGVCHNSESSIGNKATTHQNGVGSVPLAGNDASSSLYHRRIEQENPSQ